MNTTALDKLEDLLPGTFIRMFTAYLFVLAHDWNQLKIRKMNNIGFYLYETISTKNKCLSAIFLDMDITKK